MDRLSLTARLTALFALVSAGVLLGLALLIGRAVDRHFEQEDYAALGEQMALVRRIVEQPAATPAADRLAEALRNRSGMVARVGSLYATPGFDFDQQWRVVAGDGQMHVGAAAPEAWQRLASPPGAPRYRAVHGEIGALDVVLGTDTEIHDHFIREFRHTLAIYVAAAVLLSGVAGWWAARRGLQPLRWMASRAAVVTARRLDERMAVEAAPVEIRELARTLNAMLERLQRDFARLSDFSSDLAHELRTPITNLMTQTQVVLSQPRSTAKYEEVLASNTEELQRLARMVSDMLYLARVEQDITLAHPEPVALQAEVHDLFEFYEALAEERGVALAVQGEAGIVGDRLMVRRALSNLLSNALRYTPRGGRVDVAIERGPAGITLAVANDGQDIAPALLPSLFDRFFRGDRSRVRSDLDGVGLGLAITRAIAMAHGGTISVQSGSGRTCFVLAFPVAA